VRVSELISSAYEGLGLPNLPQAATDLDHLMDIGDRLREAQDDGAAAAAIAVSAIAGERYEELGAESVEGGLERDSVATIIRQLKHPDEVDLLRSVYGSRFVLLGAWSPREQRQVVITQRLRQSTSIQDESWYDQNAIRLMSRDESDGSRKLGQRVRDTFELADAYVAIRSGYSITSDVHRLVRLLFGAPFETPTRDEQAMFQAFGSRLRSSAGGRQVGAVAVDLDGELLVSGTNDVPKAGGGQYWSGDEPDHRDFQSGVDFNDQEKFQVALDLFDRLKHAGWLGDQSSDSEPKALAAQSLLPGGPLSKSRLADLLEFGRILHAEMALICTAARRGTPLRGATLYSTTYPCHACARLIIGSGIEQVVYIDPYPKSLVPRMYQTEVAEVEDLEDKVAFTAFAGVAPRLFPRVFAMAGRKRDPVTGEYLTWTAHEAMPRLVDAAVLRYPIQTGEDEVIRGLAERYKDEPEPAPPTP
jgi:cytidine deaminase